MLRSPPFGLCFGCFKFPLHSPAQQSTQGTTNRRWAQLAPSVGELLKWRELQAASTNFPCHGKICNLPTQRPDPSHPTSSRSRRNCPSYSSWWYTTRCLHPCSEWAWKLAWIEAADRLNDTVFCVFPTLTVRWSNSWCGLVCVTKLAGPNCITLSGTHSIILIAFGRLSL